MVKKLQNIRKNYSLSALKKSDMKDDPFQQFNIWFNDIVGKVIEPTAMTLSTYSKSLGVQNRIVLLKDVHVHHQNESNLNGFVFFTNYHSVKAQQINTNPKVALCFFWPILERQIRVSGLAVKINEEKSIAYFQNRPRKSQIGAWASSQSEIIEDRKVLDVNFIKFEKKFQNKSVPKPPHWGGYKVIPNLIEFWQGREDRMHDRFTYTKKLNRKLEVNWVINRLSP